MFFNKTRKKILANSKHAVTIIIEVANVSESMRVLGDISQRVSDVFNKDTTILTDLQKFSAGFRLSFTCEYYGKLNKNYTRNLANMSDWISFIEDFNCISRYHYSFY